MRRASQFLDWGNGVRSPLVWIDRTPDAASRRRHLCSMRLALCAGLVAYGCASLPLKGSPAVGVSISTDHASYVRGAPITLSLSVVNQTDTTVVLQFSSAKKYDFTIRNSADTVVWRWSTGIAFAQLQTADTLAPHATRPYQQVFSDSLVPGAYRATGFLTATGHAVSAQANFSVTP